MIKRLLKYVSYFNLKDELESFSSIRTEIEKGIRFRGTNLWILICAILVASVGLNMNSTAVIIGAMLISPLMGPINGMGYSIATYDFELFKRSVSNFTFAVIVSLFTSALYFLITPVNTAHSELLARTSPTIYDVLIAFFGGVAGILAISSKLKGNVIPGVAIATALMPPVCTAGYGLATMQFNFFFGSLYLFTINTVFIAVASMIICQVLKFPIQNNVDAKKAKRVNRIISIVLLITIIPSIILGYNLVQEENFSNNANKFIKEISVIDNNYLLEQNIDVSEKSIDLIYSGYSISDKLMNKIRQSALINNIDTTKIKVNNVSDADIINQQTQKRLTEAEILNNKLVTISNSLDKVNHKYDSILNLPHIGRKLLVEIQQVYPQLNTCSYSETIVYADSVKSNRIPVVIFGTKKRQISNIEKQKITSWVKIRLSNNETKVIFE